MRHLAETGAIRREGGRWHAAHPPRELAIPEGVREVVGRRLARLSEPANRVLTLAAAVGRDIKGKLSPLFCLAGIGLAFVNPLFACAAYVLLALMWLIPDRRIEKTIENR